MEKKNFRRLTSRTIQWRTVALLHCAQTNKKKKIRVKAFPKTKPKEPRPQLDGLCRPKRRGRRLTCTRDVPVQRSPTMGPSAFCGISLACRPWARRESYSSRLTRWFVGGDLWVSRGCCCFSGCRARTCLCCFLDSGTALAVIWNGGGHRAREGAVGASVEDKNKTRLNAEGRESGLIFHLPSRKL